MVAILPHPDIPLVSIRPYDIWVLLAAGAVFEIIFRLLLLKAKSKPASLRKIEDAVDQLRQETEYRRKMGPSHFVETSKLERQVLGVEKELEDIYTKRKEDVASVEKTIKYANMMIAFIVFVFYYGVPIVHVDDLEVSLGEFTSAQSYLKTFLFPISIVGFGVRISRWGMGEVAPCSLGALLVLWSAQTTVKMLFDAVDAYVL